MAKEIDYTDNIILDIEAEITAMDNDERRKYLKNIIRYCKEKLKENEIGSCK